MLYTFFVQGAFCKLANMPGFAPSFPVRLQFSFSALQIPGTGRSRAFRRLHSPASKALSSALRRKNKPKIYANLTKPARRKNHADKFPWARYVFPKQEPVRDLERISGGPGSGGSAAVFGTGPFPRLASKKSRPGGAAFRPSKKARLFRRNSCGPPQRRNCPRKADHSHVCGPRRVFARAHVADENGFYWVRAGWRELCEAF